MKDHEQFADILDHYGGQVRAETALALGNRGGFSGARLWKLQGVGEPVCLKATSCSAAALGVRHRLLALAGGIDFVPRVYRTVAGETFVAARGEYWQVLQWMPGRADFHDEPRDERLGNALAALASLHRVWEQERSGAGPAPAVAARVAVLERFRALHSGGWQLAIGRGDPVGPWAERAWAVVRARIEPALRKLAGWREAVPLCYCLRDVWHDHVLFVANRVSGIVDYDQAGVDTAAADLSRLLGSLLERADPRVSLALEHYRKVRPLSRAEEDLTHVLMDAAPVAAVANWLMGLYHDGRPCPNRALAARRLGALVERIE